MAEVLRFGVLGIGAMGTEHMRNIAAVPGGEVVAIADPHGPSIESGREISPEVAIHNDLDGLLARDDLDALVIATPNHTHREVVERAAGRGLHLLIEKPLCTTVQHCLELEAILEGYPGTVWVGMEYRYSPPVARLIEEVRRGATGEARPVRCGWWGFASIASRSCRRWATGTAFRGTPAARWWRSAVTSST